jgi:FixJ family two-component response regulator
MLKEAAPASILPCPRVRPHNMISPQGMVFVIDDDKSIRSSLKRLLSAADYQTEVFASASDFLSRALHPGPACVIVDVKMPA